MLFDFGGFLRISFALAALAASALASVEEAGAANPAPVWLHREGSSYALVSNKAWRVIDSNGGQTAAKQVILWGPGDPTRTTASERQDKAYIWAPVCTLASQRLVFRRQLYIPGPAKTFGAQVRASISSISGVSVFINGKFAFSAPQGFVSIPTAANVYARLFKYGVNDIEVRVLKQANSSSGVGLCRSGNPPRPLGLDFVFYGSFEANVSVSDLAKGNTATHVYRSILESTPRVFMNFGTRYAAMKNRGPSGAYLSTLQITASCGSNCVDLEVGALSKSGPEIKNCVETTLHVRHWQLRCDVERWAPGRKPGVAFKVLVNLITGSSSMVNVYVEARLFSATTDPNFNRNVDYVIGHFCKPGDPNPKCP